MLTKQRIPRMESIMAIDIDWAALKQFKNSLLPKAPEAPKKSEVELLVESFKDVNNLPYFDPIKEKLNNKIELERIAQNEQAKEEEILRKANLSKEMMGVILERNKRAQINKVAAEEAKLVAKAAAKSVTQQIFAMADMMDDDLTNADLDLILVFPKTSVVVTPDPVVAQQEAAAQKLHISSNGKSGVTTSTGINLPSPADIAARLNGGK